MDVDKVDKIIQFSLNIARDLDYWDRALGPIHLIKYVYLADLAYAEKNKGKIFTGANWRFHHFGPWSLDVFNRVEPACTAIRADKKSIPSENGEKDFTRWSIHDDSGHYDGSSDLPIVVTSSVQWAVRKFGSDTYSLLNYVYLTRPILTAAPGEALDFSSVEEDSFIETKKEVRKMSKRQEKEKEEKLRTAQVKIREKLALRREKSQGKISVRPPRYDKTFFEGCRWLDSLAGPETRDLRGEAQFTPDIWKSRSRFDPDVS